MSIVSDDHLLTLRGAISERPPYCGGVCTVPGTACILFYGKDENARRLDLSRAMEAQLEELTQVCEPATFGVNQEDVLDESYRKARKLDLPYFASTFDLARSGLIDVVRSELVEGLDEKRTIKAELYKLNVYNNGSFFKAHKDTPRAQNMFGSLVIVFPTIHEGGALLLRHGGKERSFASGKNEKAEPFVTYIAFYGDVEHEVTPVKSGHRVTLTYNLYFGDEPPVIPVVSANEDPLLETFSRLLADPTFLPEGGHLGFGLRHQYAVKTDYEYRDTSAMKIQDLNNLRESLKGSDAAISRACRSLSLEASIRIIYEAPDYGLVMCTHVVRFGDTEVDILECLQDAGGMFIKAHDTEYYNELLEYEIYRPEFVTVKPVGWVTELTPFNKLPGQYISYGNQAVLGSMYGDVCLIVHVGGVDHRATA